MNCPVVLIFVSPIHELYSNGIKAMDPFNGVKDIDIRTILYNLSGPSPALFVGTTAFRLIVKQKIKRLEDLSIECFSLIYDELVRILGQLLNKQLFRRYVMLNEKLHNASLRCSKVNRSNQQVGEGSCCYGSLLYQCWTS